MAKKASSKDIKKITKAVNYAHNKRIGFLYFMLAMALSFIIISGLITPAEYHIVAGESAPETITAPEDVIDEITTKTNRDAAETLVEPVYVTDTSVIPESVNQIQLFFTQLENARKYAVETYIKTENATRKKKDQITELDVPAEEILWADYLSSSDQKVMASLASLEYQNGQAEKIAALSAEEINGCAEKLEQILTSDHDAAELADDEAFQNVVLSRLTINYTFGDDILSFAEIAVNRYVTTNLSYDETATLALIEETRNSVEPTIYKRGQNIVVKGEVVTEAQYQVLSSLDIASSRAVDRNTYISLLAFIALLFIGFYIYLVEFETEFFKKTRNSLMVSLIILIVVLTASLTERYQPDLILVLFGTMMCAILAGQRIGVSVNFFFSLIFAAIVTWSSGSISQAAFEKIILVMVSGTASVLFLKNVSGRAHLLVAGMGAGIIGSAVIICFGYLMARPLYDMVLTSIWYIAGTIICSIIALGLLPIWETAFGLATSTKLLELLNTNKKLLQRLINEAPGTFYHSMMVANFCENAANALKANALLVKTAALYHDIGKLKNPEIFTENKSGHDEQDSMSMTETAKAIISHVADGVHLAKTNNIPNEVIEVMSQHHGNALLANFYYKVKQDNPKVSEVDFRYPFPKPTTKEAGILMIADTIEAAMRSQKDLPMEQKRERITSLIVEKFNFGLLDDCPLTRKDLGLMANIFTISLENAQHNRIKYAYSLSGKKQDDE